MMNPLFLDLAEGRLPLRRLERGTGINLVPATDDRPFFFQFGFGSPGVVSTVLGLATAVLAAVFLIPGYRLRALAQAEQKQFTWWTPLFFSAIGIGYIVIELALFQKLVYYLGDPSRALALLLAALLAGNGLGSFISQGCQEKVATLGALLSAVGALLIAVVMPALFSALQNSSSAVQQGAAALILFVEGVPMGLMFPIGLRVVQERLGDSAAPWMWAVNGSASVVGSALAVVAAISAGHTWSLIIGATCYVIAALCVRLAFERRAGDALARGLRSP